jgi:Symplekin/PTA1 N-terminal
VGLLIYQVYHLRYILDYRDVDLLSAMLNSWATLVKQRPSKLPYLITALRAWTPAALTGLLASSIKSAEKAVRILLAHISRCVILIFHDLRKN